MYIQFISFGIYILLIGCSETFVKEETVPIHEEPLKQILTPEEQLMQIIDYKNLPQSPTSMKPGFSFNTRDYTLLHSFDKTRDSISLLGKGVVMQNVVLEDNETELFCYLIVNSNSCNEARENLIDFVPSITMKMITSFTMSSADIGEFNIVPKHSSDKIVDLIHFIRNNIVVSLLVTEGEFDVESLAKKIDEKIQGLIDYDDYGIELISPQINRIISPKEKILLNNIFKITIDMAEKPTNDDLLSFIKYDEDKLNLEEQDGLNAIFEALRIGETVINFTVVDKKSLLSTTESKKINISEK